MWKLLNFLGFYGDDGDDYEDDEDYDVRNEQAKPAKNSLRGKASKKSKKREANNPGLVMFKGVPSEETKYKLRDALRSGTMLLLDLSELNDRELDEEGRQFRTFMGGVAFASGGHIAEIGREQYLVTPSEGMFEEWVEGADNEREANY